MTVERHPLHPGDNVPFFIAAGVLKERVQLEQFYDADPQTVPALTLGAFTLHEWGGNAKPGEQDFIYYPDRQMAGNARGLPNPGIEGIYALLEPVRILGQQGVKTIIQITNLPHERPDDVMRELAAAAVEINPTAIEVNLSCPNGKSESGFHPPICYNPDASAEVMSTVREQVGDDVCLIAKDSPHVTSADGLLNEDEIRELAGSITPFINGVVGINTIGNQPFPEIVCGDGRGGMSGPVVAAVANRHQQLWKDYAPDIPYFSCGGVDTSNVAEELPKRLAMGAYRVGGAQEFYRATRQMDVAINWILRQ